MFHCSKWCVTNPEKRKQTNPIQMEEAVKLVLDGKGIRKVSEERGMSKSTLQKINVAKTKSNGGTTGRLVI